MTMAAKRVVNVINLGRMGFLKAWDLQVRYANQHLDQLAGLRHATGRDTLLLVEHNPVYTVGIRTKGYDEFDEARLKKLGAEFYRTNRGGLITFHGPGQLVAYPIINLRHFKPSMRWYISTLENTIINTCRAFNITACTTKDTGVWVQDRKIAAIGVHGSRYITMHGVSLNSDTDLTWFRHIVPCGIEGRTVTSLTEELDKATPTTSVIPAFLSAFEEEFGCEIEYSMFDSDDNNLLKGGSRDYGAEGEEKRRGVQRNEEERDAGIVGGSMNQPPPLHAASAVASSAAPQPPQRVRLMSTSAASQTEARAMCPSRPTIPMW